MIPDDVTALPLYPHLDEIAGTLAARNLLLLHAEPGAGKTTLVPWRLLAHEAFTGTKFLLLQPRRITARLQEFFGCRDTPSSTAHLPPVRRTKRATSI